MLDPLDESVRVVLLHMDLDDRLRDIAIGKLDAVVRQGEVFDGGPSLDSPDPHGPVKGCVVRDTRLFTTMPRGSPSCVLLAKVRFWITSWFEALLGQPGRRSTCQGGAVGFVDLLADSDSVDEPVEVAAWDDVVGSDASGACAQPDATATSKRQTIRRTGSHHIEGNAAFR